MGPEQEPAQDRADGPALQEAALSGVRWFAIGKVFTEIAALGAQVALARLIAPAEFGAVAPSVFVLSIGAGLAAASFGSPLVRARTLTKDLAQTSFALSLITGVVMTALIIGLLELWDFGYSSHAIELMQIVAFSFLLYSAGAVSQAMLERDLDFRRTAINEVASLIPSMITSVSLALAGLEGLAIVIGFLVLAGFTSAQAIWWRRPPFPRLHKHCLREILSFGLPTSISSMLYTAQRTIGLGILGARLDAVSAGYFWRASQLGVDYQSRVTSILQRIMFPLLARASSDDQLRRARSRMVQAHTALLFPLLAMLIVLAPDLVPWLFGEEWAGAVRPTQIMAVVGLTMVVNTGVGPLMMALGRPRALLIKDAIELPLLIAVIVMASGNGLTAVCTWIAVFRVVSLVANQYFLVDRLGGIPVSETLVRDVLPAAVSAVLAVVVALLASAALEDSDMPVLATMVLVSSAGLISYCVVLRGLFRSTWKDCTMVITRLNPRGQPAG